MGISVEELSVAYPRLYHITHEGSWPGIQKHGLLSTEALVDLFCIDGTLRNELLRGRRPDCVSIQHPDHGRAIIRDQKPLIESRLRTALRDGLTPQDWYAILNRKTFFWVSEERFERLRTASAYEALRQTLIVVDSAKLLSRHAERVTLCPINSGATRPFAWPRGKDSFLSIEEYPFEEFRKKRGRKNAVAEFSVDYSVPDICDFVISVSELGGGRKDKTIWP